MSLTHPENDRMICFCHCVRRQEITQAVHNGNHTLHEIQMETLASTGCGGCEWEVLEILQDELAQSTKKP